MEVKIKKEVKVDGNPWIYLSGPITGYDIEERKRYFGSLEKVFEMAGFEVVNPLKKRFAGKCNIRRTYQERHRVIVDM